MTDVTKAPKALIERPLSPHLQIYRPMLTMMMSIAHRITGAALYVGTLLVAWLLVAAASGPAAYATASGFLTSWFGKLILFGYTWALMHHMLGASVISCGISAAASGSRSANGSPRRRSRAPAPSPC